MVHLIVKVVPFDYFGSRVPQAKIGDNKNEQRKLVRQKNKKNTTRHTGKNITNITVIELKKYNKDYKQLEVFCDYCHCKVKKSKWSKHLQTEKHKHNETI